MKDKPTVVCLCGSSRFYDAYQKAEYEVTMAGEIYLSIGFYPHGDKHGEGVGHDSQEKVALDELHKRKIDLADYVYVLNVGGYIGDSTRSEVEYAIEHSKPVRWLEPEYIPEEYFADGVNEDSQGCVIGRKPERAEWPQKTKCKPLDCRETF